MRSRTLVVWAGVAGLLVLCLVMVCQVRSCARRLGIGPIGQIGPFAAGVRSLLAPAVVGTEPTKPNVVPPGHSALPSASRRPVFGTPGTEGTEIRILPQRHEDTTGEDTTRILVRRDGTVINRGRQNVKLLVTRVGPAWIEWDLSLGVCAMARIEGEGESGKGKWTSAGAMRWRGYAIDFGAKVKLIDFRPGRVVQIGVPVLYATTGGPGVGCDVRITGMEWIALDAGWFPMVGRAAVGISLNLP